MCVCVYVCSWYIHHHYFPEMARLMGPEGMHLCVCVPSCALQTLHPDALHTAALHTKDSLSSETICGSISSFWKVTQFVVSAGFFKNVWVCTVCTVCSAFLCALSRVCVCTFVFFWFVWYVCVQMNVNYLYVCLYACM